MTICQHVHRVGRQGRHDRAGRDHLRVPEGPPVRAAGRRLGRRARVLAHAAHRRGRDLRHRGASSTRARDHPVRHLGHQPRSGRAAGRAWCRTRRSSSTEAERAAAQRALEYMDLRARHAAARRRRSTWSSSARAPTAGWRTCAPPPTCCAGHQVADGVRMLVVPGSAAVREAAEEEGLDKVFTDAGAEWRFAGCSMCLGMNPDTLKPGPALPPPPPTATSRAGRAAAGVPTWSRRRSPPPPPWSAGWPPRPTCEGQIRHGQVHRPHRHRRPAAAVQRGHRPDHPGGVPQAGDPHRLRGRAVQRLARGPGVRAQRPGLRRRHRSSSPGRSSAPGRRASTPSGRLRDWGFRAVISPRFGDIFRGNALKEGLLPVELELKAVEALWDAGRGRPGHSGSPSTWPRREVRAGDAVWAFPLDDFSRWRLHGRA